ncbi:TIGR01906 family membrane protein [Micrococcus sp. M4NT]|uniref:TIGR01906 family membrane protein n=1 Tax=Micrococcus sp. M4NT TaxID=2957501 RepID=UPI0029AC006E|nr:TIGR01906 family membrane protein [Micrococcus sp. M4NT]MDX2341107.1 TIGR01906 family membrane protein [Micrococcus sp. M4NT]
MSSFPAGRGREERSGSGSADSGEFESGLDYGAFAEDEPQTDRTQALPRTGADGGDQHTTALDPDELARLRGADAPSGAAGSSAAAPAEDIVASRPVASTTPLHVEEPARRTAPMEAVAPAAAAPAWPGAAGAPAAGGRPAGAVAEGPSPEERARLPKGGPRVAQTLLAILAPLWLLLTAVKLVASPAFLWLEYHRPGFPADRFGFTMDDRMHYGSAGLDYLGNLSGTRYLSSLTHGGGPLFTEAEVSHMADVKTVMLWATVALVVLTVLCILLIVHLLRNNPGGVRRALFAAAAWFLVALIVLAVLAVIGWSSFFAGFHSLFFADGSWTFSVQDALIRLYPSQFWIDAAVAVGLISLLTALLTLVFTWPTRRRRERTADQRSAFESTRLRWAREEDAQLR